MKVKQKGFIHFLLLLAFALVVFVSVGYVVYKNRSVITSLIKTERTSGENETCGGYGIDIPKCKTGLLCVIDPKFSGMADASGTCQYPSDSSKIKYSENTQNPVVTIPGKHTKVTSPVIIKGTVPPGWMFEGVFPIKIVEHELGVLVQGLAQEVIPGSWQSDQPVEFEAILELPERAIGSGTIILENDNPSGLPENAKSFQIPILF